MPSARDHLKPRFAPSNAVILSPFPRPKNTRTPRPVYKMPVIKPDFTYNIKARWRWIRPLSCGAATADGKATPCRLFSLVISLHAVDVPP